MKNELSKYIGKKIKEFRNEKKLTQSQLAEKIGKQPKTISDYERGKIAPSQDVLYALSEVFDVKIDALFPAQKEKSALHEALLQNENNYNIKDILFLKNLLEYVEDLEENDRNKLFDDIELVVELFKKKQ